MKLRHRLFAAFLCLLLAAGLCGCNGQETSSVSSAVSSVADAELPLRVHYLDVGQGDSIFLELPGGRCMLIDSGESEYAQTVIDAITGYGYQKLDYVIVTHPHTDHMGSMAKVIGAFEIGKIFMPRSDASTGAYENLLKAIAAKNLKITAAKAGGKVLEEENLHAEFLAPNSDSYSGCNNYSAVLKLTFGKVRYLFMGDAETLSEKEIKADVSADVVKVGHHGSDTSSGAEFVKRVGAKIAVVSVGDGNSYRLPNQKILERWTKSGAALYRTDELGTITVSSDGTALRVSTGAGESTLSAGSAQSVSTSSTAAGYILNTKSKKIHSPDCAQAEQIAAGNRAQTDKLLQELLEEGYTPCGTCHAGQEGE